MLSPRPAEAQKKQLEASLELTQDECVSENAEQSLEEPAEGAPDADGEELTDGVEEDFDEDGAHELVGGRAGVAARVPSQAGVTARGLISSPCACSRRTWAVLST